MSEVITEKDKEYEAREEANAPGADQAMSDRVNNRSLRPNSSAFIDFMKTGWDASEPEIEPLESSKFTPARLAALGKAFPGERLVIPAGSPKVRNNDCDYMFRPDTTFAYYTGLGQDYEAGAVLVLNPLDPDSPEAKAGKTHEAELFVAPRADTATQDFFMTAHYGEYWVGPRAGLKEMTAMTGIETHDIAQLADALSKDVGAEAGAVRVRVISDADPQVTSLVESIREANGYTDPDKNNAADDKASGGSAVMQIARAFQTSGKMPVRYVSFAVWDGEENGDLGSKYFMQHCDFIKDIKGYLNFDMIGRNNRPEQPEHVVYFYTEAHPALGQWLKDDIARYGLKLQPDYRPWDRPVGGSDNASFAVHDIPIIWYHTDGHPDYHQPSDHADKLNWEKVVEITKASFLNAWNLANEKSY